MLEWKNARQHKPLLVRGARQVGKSWAVRHLGESFDNMVEVNFEKKPDMKSLFEQFADVKELTAHIAMAMGTTIEPGKTLLFLDEIQACPAAIKSLWFFKEDYPELHVAAAGSLLEFALKGLSSFGVGRIHSLFMYPMSFDEFLVATGRRMWLDEKRKADSSHPLFSQLHDELVKCFRTYIMVGGMPASVAAWAETHDFVQCRSEQMDIQLTYYDDFPKYAAKVDPVLLRNTLQSVVMQTGGKFTYGKVEGGYKAEKVKEALGLLCDAGIIKRVSHSAGNGLPLGVQANDKFRKYIYLDSGMMLGMMDTDLGGARELTEAIVTGAAGDLVNKGGIAELVLGWELVKYSRPISPTDLYYWENTSDGSSSEVDYLVPHEMKVLPIECKSGVTGKMKSLRLFMKNKGLERGVRCSLENFALLQDKADPSQKIHIVPLYAVSNLK